MTQEEKQLLLKDLCARLPYGVKIQRDNVYDANTKVIETLGIRLTRDDIIDRLHTKPFLRPMSSMTEEEKKEFDKVLKSCNDKVFACPDKERRYNFFDAEQEDFMNAHHFDYRGLIEKGLALEAPKDMYKF